MLFQRFGLVFAVRNKHTKFEEDQNTGSMLNFGEIFMQKVIFRGGGGNFKRRLNTLLGNVVRNMHSKFEQERNIFTLSNLRGTQKTTKFMGGGEEYFFRISENGEIPCWEMF